jgi:hypothetical protein
MFSKMMILFAFGLKESLLGGSALLGFGNFDFRLEFWFIFENMLQFCRVP